VDDYGLARAVGRLNLRDPADFMDIKVVFRNIEMSGLTPYAATFAGRRIDSGKLSLDLEYKIKQRQLQGENQIVMDQLTLGEKVDSPQAHDIPLDLVIGILQDADGRINLGLPMSGSLDDPKFSFAALVWKAIGNVFSKIASAPFRALGALFGSKDKFDNIVFDAGSAHLTPPEREKLLRLAEALAKRPALYISVHGVYADTDRVALQDMQLRLALAHMNAQHVEAGEDPGPVATHQPRVRAALETMFSDRFGRAELAALKEGFRRANPGQLEESVSGHLTSTLTGLFRKKQVLSDSEVSKLTGVDFYTLLFERLRNAIVIDDKQLQILAAMRGEAAAALLKEDGAQADHVSLMPVEKIAAEGRDVPIKLVLGSKPAGRAGASAN
jgi:outer membrane protein OmpA-like peptidoglycan-associated protein